MSFQVDAFPINALESAGPLQSNGKNDFSQVGAEVTASSGRQAVMFQLVDQGTVTSIGELLVSFNPDSTNPSRFEWNNATRYRVIIEEVP